MKCEIIEYVKQETLCVINFLPRTGEVLNIKNVLYKVERIVYDVESEGKDITIIVHKEPYQD